MVARGGDAMTVTGHMYIYIQTAWEYVSSHCCAVIFVGKNNLEVLYITLPCFIYIFH